MKKVISIMLAVLLLFCSLSGATVSAAEAQINKSIPLIIVPGYSASELYYNYGQQDEEHIWGVQMEPIIDKVISRLAVLGISIGDAFATKNKDLLIETIADSVEEIFEKMKMADDGTSLYNVSAGFQDPAEATTAAIVEKYGEDAGELHLPEINLYYSSIIGAENVFNAHIDFRQGAIKCAEDLRVFVEKVKQYTGSSKVRLFGLSHGGMTVGVYLSLYGTLGDVDSAVMFHPALRGAYFLQDIISQSIKLDASAIAEFAQVGAFSETTAEFIINLLNVDFLDELANDLAGALFDDLLGNWGSVWDFMPTESYEQYKELYLDEVKNAQIIKASDKMHYEIMPNYASAFKAAQQAGVRINIFSGTGRSVVTGGQVNSDGILALSSTSGALVAPYGQRFSDGYKQSGSVCTDPTHNHVSPAMDYDASYCYLPENTWFVDGQFHGQIWWDKYTKELSAKLLFEDSIEDIYSDPAYTQFETAQNPKDAVHIRFDGTDSAGRISSETKGAYVTNLSEKYSLRLTSMYAMGADVTFNILSAETIAPGATAYVELNGRLPDVNMARDTITVNYIQLDKLAKADLRSFPVTIVGGADVEFDSSAMYSDVDMVDPFDDFLKEDSKLHTILSRLGLMDFLSGIYNSIMKYFGKLFEFIRGFID